MQRGEEVSMFKSIVWATDGSEAADQALPYTESLARESGAAVTIVHFDQHLVGRGSGMPLLADEVDIKAKIEAQAQKLAESGLDVTLRVEGDVTGGAARHIAEAAESASADLIVVGTRGHTKLGGLLLGSVTQRLLHIAPCPILAVPSVDRLVAGSADRTEISAGV
ncbi:MAG: universal stress protein [Thermoleophilaceae bacterium]